MENRRKVKQGAVAFFAGLAVLIAFFITGMIVVGVAAFGLMVLGIVTLAGNLAGSLSPRRPPGPGLQERASTVLRGWEEAVRRRYGRR